MIGRLPDGMMPKIASANGNVGLWATEDGEDFGLAMSPLAAIQTGLRLIALGGQASPGGGCEINPTAIAFDAAEYPSEECVARLLITIEDAKIGIVFDAQQLVEVTAAMINLAKRTT